MNKNDSMKLWDEFMKSIIKEDYLLFKKDGNKPAIIKTHLKQKERFVHGEKVLANIKSIIERVRSGKTKHKGVVYIMYYINDLGRRVPLYIGKSEFKGKKRKISANASNLSPTGPFLRWGARPQYHMGDLFEAYRGRAKEPKYKDWNAAIFNENGEFEREIYHTMFSFDKMEIPICILGKLSVPAVENALIMWAGRLFPNDLLNRDGKSRFAEGEK